jgi:hypothetical protein
MLKYLTTATEYCIGNGSKKECPTCQHERAWDELNTLPDASRLAKQRTMIRISDDQCILTNTSYYKPIES